MCKCGKANQPTRKYCIRCGELLIEIEDSVKEESKLEPAMEPPTKKEAHREETSDIVSRTTADKWVRPSQVNKERMRTAERHIDKTEFEKAQEAFSREKSVEGDERMLRASEIHEIMAEVPAQSQLDSPIEPTPTEVPEPSIPVTSTPQPESQPVSGVSSKTIEMESPKTKNLTETDSIIESTTGLSTPPQEPVLEPPPEVLHPEILIPESPSKEAPTAEQEGMPEPPVVSKKEGRPSQEDSLVRELQADIAHYEQQMEQLENELEELKADHEGEKRWLTTVAETKRIRAEALQEDLKKAKSDYNDAKKELKSAEKRMKSEFKESMNRIRAQKKRISEAEKKLKKRQSELEKNQE